MWHNLPSGSSCTSMKPRPCSLNTSVTKEVCRLWPKWWRWTCHWQRRKTQQTWLALQPQASASKLWCQVSGNWPGHTGHTTKAHQLFCLQWGSHRLTSALWGFPQWPCLISSTIHQRRWTDPCQHNSTGNGPKEGWRLSIGCLVLCSVVHIISPAFLILSYSCIHISLYPAYIHVYSFDPFSYSSFHKVPSFMVIQ